MKILYIASNPEGEAPLDIEHEVNQLQEEIDKLVTSETVDLRVYSRLQVEALPEVIARVQPDALHFAAHGQNDGIVLAHKTLEHVVLDGDMLADFLAALTIRPKLVVINACNSSAMAQKLVRSADFVIGTDAEISNVGARTMAATLYQRLAAAASVWDAFKAAEAMLTFIDQRAVKARLFPEDAVEIARLTRLTDPLRVVACFPQIEKVLEHGHLIPPRGFRPEAPYVQFGLAGAPADTVQSQFFTDDPSIVPTKEGESLADARSWLLDDRPVKGEIWVDPYYPYYGDMRWYGTVVTAGHQIFSTTSTTIDALVRYYFDEQWRGALPNGIAAVVRTSLEKLRANDGSRRGPMVQRKLGTAPPVAKE